MRNGTTLTTVAVAVVVICARTVSAGHVYGRHRRETCASDAGRGHRRMEARLKSRVQAYNIVNLFCPFDEYRYWIVTVIAVIAFLIAVVLVYCRYSCDDDADDEDVSCQHVDDCEPNDGGMEEAVGDGQNGMPQGSPK